MIQSRAVHPLSREDFDERFRDRHLLHAILERWARERPEHPAMISADSGQVTSWGDLERITRGLAMRLVEMGYQRGDRFASALPLLTEHLLLELACFRIGVIFAPLDLRLSPAEMIRNLGLLRPKGFAFCGAESQTVPGSGDFSRFGKMVETEAPFVEHRLCFFEGDAAIVAEDSGSGLLTMRQMLARASELASGKAVPETTREAFERATAGVDENDGALVIFTTGSTGSPKPALLSHRNITCQSMCISQAFFRGDSGMRTLVNLPPSHVGCQTELLMGTFFGGGTAVLLTVFDPLRSLRAIQEYKVQVLGQIPAQFQFEWRLKDYASFDLSSLQFVAYGGQQVSEAFIEKMAAMAPWVGTGLGLTETAGFCTYQFKPREQARDCLHSLGVDMPVYAASIRGAMREDGFAAAALPEGEVGHICFHGPQTFLGYLNDPEATARTISRDGFLYTGDLGFKDSEGIHFSARAKWVIKPSGYQVFPSDVENHFCVLAEVAACAVVGVAHALISEAIVAFVEIKPGAELSYSMLERHARELATYMRPRHFVLLQPSGMPLNRVAKPDYLRLREMAEREIGELREKGKWDRM
ncbi:MAG: class I adenylate-forming enzyme family protein [Candidatus Korobacteraceae bacterium]